MGKIAVVTDSVACVPPELVERYDIHVVPFHVIWDGKDYRDGVDMSPAEFYQLFCQNKAFPTTAQPSLADFARTYACLSEKADGIVSIHVPAELTGAISVARTAAQEAASVPVRVVDSRMATMAQGFIVLEAARTAAAGGTLDEVVAAAEAMISKVDFFATLDDLKHLHRGGRIGEAATLLGSKLRINPILSLAHGRVRVLGVVRTRRNAVEKMIEMMWEKVGERPLHASVFHGDALAEAERIAGEIKSRFDCVEFYITEFTPVMGAHTGPGVIGLAFYGEEGDEASGPPAGGNDRRLGFLPRALSLWF
ncbi:MAG: DegV family EDD domain-containing protein [Anaerolineae bacterium]|nr:DegV family EDD domain-containing protein [Anaerolineae bacterium]NIN94399.1 DegV family EDD domain-containing protein [Anaerolineae bacterium]NIQ77465.1 DegV family EDD domain-containing protein [Anaerolineae bacterium]